MPDLDINPGELRSVHRPITWRIWIMAMVSLGPLLLLGLSIVVLIDDFAQGRDASLSQLSTRFGCLGGIGLILALLLGFPLGFFQSGIIAGMGATFAELFPTRVRATGQGFSYNTGRAVGSFVPALVGVVAASIGLGQAMGVCAASAYVLVLIAAAMLPETRGQELEGSGQKWGHS